MMELKKAESPKDASSGTWQLGVASDKSPRLYWTCPVCSKNHAFDPATHTPGEDGTIVGPDGKAVAVECTRKTCEFKDELQLVE